MEIKVTQEKYNPLLKRREVAFEVKHEQTMGTPPRLEIRQKLAEVLKTKAELVYVKRVETRTGTMTAKGEANAYDSVEQAKLVEPHYIIARNAPPKEKEKEKETVEKTEESKESREMEKPQK